MDARTKRKELETEKETEKETKTEKDTAKRELDLTPSKKPKVSDEDAKLEALWTSAKCKELVTKQTIVTIDAKDNLLKACEILGSAGVSSAPIWSKDDQKLCGMFDFRDLGAVLLKAFQSELTDTQKKSLHSLDSILKKHSAELASDLSHHDKFYTVDQDASLLDAVDFFGQGLHRVVMLDSDKKAVAILSQSDALKYFWAHLQKGELKWLGDKTVDEMKLIHETVVALDENSPVLDALKLMYERGLSSIAVTERKAKPVITANFSVTDIKYLVRNHKLDTLHEPCKQFIQEVRTTKDRENDYKTTLPVFVITKDTTLSHCVGKLVATRAHRLWVVKGPLDHQVVGVVSLSDILRGITPKDSQHRWRHHPFISFVPSS